MPRARSRSFPTATCSRVVSPRLKELRSGRVDHHPVSRGCHPLDPAHNRLFPRSGVVSAREAAALYEDRSVAIYRVLGGHTEHVENFEAHVAALDGCGQRERRPTSGENQTLESPEM